MDLKPVSLRTTRWGAAAIAVATAAATAVAMSGPATQAQVVGGDVASAPSRATAGTNAGGFSDDKWGDSVDDRVSQDVYGKNQAEVDPGSLYTVGKATGARDVWSNYDKLGRRVTGQGVGVAVLDSGVSQVAGLNGTGKVTYGPDLSIEGNGALTHQDTFGHGTYMAAIIAGRGTTTTSSLPSQPADVQLGIAPDAKLLALKLANSDGSTDVSQVIAGLDWVTQNPVMPDGTRVRVINLSYGTSSAQSYLADPLAAAVENAWQHGIVVVTSAGNDGALGGRLTNPAINPYVIAVGATDSRHSRYGWSYDRTIVAPYSQVGSAARHADLVAPGTSLVSARVPGSFVDLNNPSGLVAGDVSGKLFRGSGTSQAAAVVSGSVALLLQAYPTLTPDQVKFILTDSAHDITYASTIASGAGTLDLTKALYRAGQLTGTGFTGSVLRVAAVQAFAHSTGQGSIDAARGGSILTDASGIDLSGEVDVQGNAWDPAAWWLATSNGSAWVGGKWLGTTWTGATWEPASSGFSSARWSSARWSSARWSTADWSSTSWTSARWSSARWSSARWSSVLWSDLTWS
jgi:serine protease AprX